MECPKPKSKVLRRISFENDETMSKRDVGRANYFLGTKYQKYVRVHGMQPEEKPKEVTEQKPEEKLIPKKFYAFGLLVIFIAVYVQYVVPLGRILGFVVVYGIPVLVVSFLAGKQILKKANKNNVVATKYGLGLFGIFTLASIFLSIIVLIILVFFNPQTISLLEKPNPVLQVPPSLALVMTVVSLLIVGPAEEYLFRGFVYGGLLNMFKGQHWISLAFISSLVFAAVHLYYALTYGAASIIPFIDIVTFGMAMAMTYYLSGGNIVIPALIHGVYDATGFFAVATNLVYGVLLRVVLIVIGVVFAAIYIRQKTFKM